MQDFGQPSYDPFGDPLDDPLENPLGDPFDPFADPFEATFNALGPGVPGSLGALDPSAATNFQGPLADQDNLNMDNLGEMLDSLEDNIENSPPIPPVSETDDLDTLLTAFEKNIENTSVPPEPKIEVELFQDSGWGYPTPSIDTPSPPPGIYDNPTIRSIPDNRPTGRRGGMTKTKSGAGNKIWCPIKDDYVSPETCNDCKYFDPEIHECRYGEENQKGDEN